MNTLVMMFHYGRCGSTVLSDMLSQQDRILCLGEIYNFNLDYSDVDLLEPIAQMVSSNRFDHAAISLNDAITFLESVITASKIGAEKDIVVFEVKQYDFDRRVFDFSLSEFLSGLEERFNLEVILLERINLFDRYLSERLSQKTGIYHLKPDQSCVAHQRLTVDTVDLSMYIFKEAADYLRNRMFLVDFNPCCITYEHDISKNPYIAFYKICTLLGVDATHPQINFGLTTPKEKENIINNFNDVLDVLKKNGFAWMI